MPSQAMQEAVETASPEPESPDLSYLNPELAEPQAEPEPKPKAETQDEPETEMPSDTAETKAPAEPEIVKAPAEVEPGKKPPADEDAKTHAPALSAAEKALAIRAGITEERAVALFERGVLSDVLDAHFSALIKAGGSEQAAPTAAAQVEPKPAPTLEARASQVVAPVTGQPDIPDLPEDEFTPESITAWRAMKTEAIALRQERAEIREALAVVKEFRAAAAHAEWERFVTQSDAWMSGLGPEYETSLGKGSAATLARDSVAMQNRAKVIQQMQLLHQASVTTGEGALDEESLRILALHHVVGRSVLQSTGKTVMAQLKEREKKFVNRASGQRPQEPIPQKDRKATLRYLDPK